MADFYSITVDKKALLIAIDEAPEAVLRHLKAAARITADNIGDEGRRRVRRRTGKTAEEITVEESKDGTGYVIYVANAADRWPNLDIGLEFGTKYMRPFPFLIVSARLEEGAHERRAFDAIRAAVAEKGFGE